jgi:hypothetical protein
MESICWRYSNYRCRTSANRCPYSCKRCHSRRHTCRRLLSCPQNRCCTRQLPQPPCHLQKSESTQRSHAHSSSAVYTPTDLLSKQQNFPNWNKHSSLAEWHHRLLCTGCKLGLRSGCRMARKVSRRAHMYLSMGCRIRPTWLRHTARKQPRQRRTSP